MYVKLHFYDVPARLKVCHAAADTQGGEGGEGEGGGAVTNALPVSVSSDQPPRGVGLREGLEAGVEEMPAVEIVR
jgi:hypothetical protein